MSKVAVVTGSNKGIGFAIVKELARQFKGDVLLTGNHTNFITNSYSIKPNFNIY